MSEISEKMKGYIDSEIGQAVLTLGAYTVKATKTLKDDEIVDNADEIVGELAEALKTLSNSEVSVSDAKSAAMVLLKAIAVATPTKWDDRLIPIIDMFL